MSVGTSVDDAPPGPLSGWPTFALDWAYDDDGDPSTLTVFPAGGGPGLATQWLTVDVEHAVSLDELR